MLFLYVMQPLSCWYTRSAVLMAVNTAGELAGIDDSTASPEGGAIARDLQGHYTGILAYALPLLRVKYLHSHGP